MIAAELAVGDRLQTLDGASVAITGITREWLTDPVRTFNLDIHLCHGDDHPLRRAIGAATGPRRRRLLVGERGIEIRDYS